MKKTIAVFLFIQTAIVFAQQNYTDSVIAVFNNKQLTDSVRLTAIDDLAWEYAYNNPDSGLIFATMQIELATKLNNKLFVAKAYTNKGAAYTNKSDFSNALNYYQKSLRFYETSHNNRGIAVAYHNIGNVYSGAKNYAKALESYFVTLKMEEKIIQPNGEIGDLRLRSSCFSNMGAAYNSLHNYQKALEFLYKALKISQALEDDYGILNCYSNISTAYTYNDQPDSSIIYYNKQLVLAKRINNMRALGNGYVNLASFYNDYFDFNKVLAYSDSALKLNIELRDVDLEREAYSHLSLAYAKANRYKEAYQYKVKFQELNDSIYNLETTKQLSDLKTNYAVEKKEIELKAEALAEKKKQQLIILFVALGLLGALIFAVFVVRSLRIRNKQNKTILAQNHLVEKQKLLVEKKNKDITDSINYAKRIQYTLLAHKEFLQKNMPEHFILFKPKDIVSGDFYWATKSENTFYLGICDSTGHGVPGAFMSLLNISFLNEAINEKNILEPHLILNYVRQKLIDSVSQDGAKDGMDGTLLRFRKQESGIMIDYASANNAPVLIKDNQLVELGKDKMPIGKGEILDSFNLYTIDTNQKNISTLYLFTDGYADQFGGNNGNKKLTRKKFKELLLSIHHLPMAEQEQALDTFITNYRKDVEQIDDILVMGLRL
jgi:serine phosphatase RsbU (regulator of sigma subunit)